MKKELLKELKKTKKNDEVPISCIITRDGEIISKSYNKKIEYENSLSHAEINAMNEAMEKLNTKYLDECELHVTLEPCIMCAGAMIQSRIKKVYFYSKNKRGGALTNKTNIFDIENTNHKFEYEYIEFLEYENLLKSFFKEKRK